MASMHTSGALLLVAHTDFVHRQLIGSVSSLLTKVASRHGVVFNGLSCATPAQ